MKTKITYIVAIFILISCSGPAVLAPDGSEISSETNTIIIKSDNNDAWQLVGKKLANMGYSIKETNKDFGTINTGWKEAPGKALQAATDLKINFVVDGDDIRITGKTRAGVSLSNYDSGESEIQAKGQKGSQMRLAWQEMYRVAKELNKALDGSMAFETR